MSGVYNDPLISNHQNRYQKGDLVKMSRVESGIRYVGVFTVKNARMHSSGNYYEYKLADAEGSLYQKGAWVKEKDLRIEQKRGKSPVPGRASASGYVDVPGQISSVHFDSIYEGYRKRGKTSSSLSASEKDDTTATGLVFTSELDNFKDIFVSRLVDDLFEITPTTTGLDANNGISPEMCDRIFSRALPAFARKIGHTDQTQVARDVMVFVLRHEKLIISSYKARAFAKEKPTSAQRPDSVNLGEPPAADILPSALSTKNENIFVDVDNQDKDFRFQQYRSLVTGHPAYKWLLDKVNREFRSSTPEQELMHGISNKILKDVSDMVPPFQIYSRHKAPHICEMNFNIAWDLFTFLEEQDFKISPEEAVQEAITLTGTASNAQALTTANYMNQTWGSVGDELLAILRDIIRDGKTTTSSVQTYSLADLTVSTVGSWDTVLQLKVSGTLESVAEVAEALGWLSAALRSSSKDRGVAVISPVVANICVQSYTAGSTSLSCEIDFHTEVEVTGSELNGQCWHNLFQNPVVVKGYPIKRKPADDTGIEMPLDIIAALARANQITTFLGHTFIKGFSTMLLLTGVIGDVFIWHLLSNNNGERISYTDPRVHKAMAETQLKADLGIAVLGPSRHLIGWCSNVASSAGSSKANYSIRWSGLPEPPSRVALQNVSINAGKIATVGVGVVLGKRDKPIYITQSDNYITQLRWIGRQFVVLYDLDDRRAWLVDGLSALLHLVLASLAAERDEDFFYEEDVDFCFEPEQLKEADPDRRARSESTQDASPHNARVEMPNFVHNAKVAATAVLTNRANRVLKLYRKIGETPEDVSGAEQTLTTKPVKKNKNTLQCFQDRVEQIYSTLEQVIDDHTHRTSEDGFGFRLKTTNRRQIGGWDFMDVAANNSPFYLHVTTLRATGTGWIDFTRAIHAVTLFGKGFGEILKPADGIQICSKWATMPKGQDYLAVCASDMHEILKTKGDVSCDPWRVIDDIHWHHTPFENCSCTETTSPKKGCNKVQVLAYRGIFKNFSKKSLQGPFNMGKAGAVIFGHS